MDTLAPDTAKPSAAPDTDNDSEPSPATPSAVESNRKEADPLRCPAPIVTVKFPTAA